MKPFQFLPILSLGLFLFALPTANGQEHKDIKKVRAVMAKQAEDWNRGDIDAFMEGYWNSEELQFIGSKGISYGWQTTLDNYKKSYPNKDAMGKLTFEILDIKRLSKKVIQLSGKWTLTRKEDEPGGYYLLVWKKIKGEWKIIADHTN